MTETETHRDTTMLRRYRALLPRVVRMIRRHWAILLVATSIAGGEYISFRITAFAQKYQIDVHEYGSFSPLAVRGLPRGKQDEVPYLPISRRVFGQGLASFIGVGDAFVYEYREVTTPMPTLSLITMGAIVRAIGDPDRAYVVLSALSWILSILMTYWLVYYAGRGRLLALVAATTVILLSWVWCYLPPFVSPGNINLYHLATIPRPDINLQTQFDRIPFNGWSFPWLMAGVLALTWCLEARSVRSVVIAGVTIGAQAMIYPYFATSFALGLPVFFIWLAFRREWLLLGLVSIVAAVAAVVAVPPLIAQVRFSALPQHADVVNSLGTLTREWDADTAPFLVSVAILWTIGTLIPGRWRWTYLVLLTLVVGAALSLNLQVLTGVDVQRWHWTARVTRPVFALAMVLAGGMGIRRWVVRSGKGARWAVAAPLMAGMLATFAVTRTVSGFIATATEWSPYAFVPFDHREAYEWLRDSAHDDAVVLTLSTEQTYLIPTYANTYLYVPFGPATVTPCDEIIIRLATGCRYYGMPEVAFQDLVSGPGTDVLYNVLPEQMSAEAPPWWFERTMAHATFFHKRYRKTGNQSVPYQFPDSVAAGILSAFRSIGDPDSALRRYRVDYIWQGPYERAVGIDSLDLKRNVELAFEAGRVRIYRVLHADSPHEASRDR